MVDKAGRVPGRWTRVALIVSLALNLAVAGMIGGAMLRTHPWGPPEGVHDHGGARRDRPPPELRELGPLPFIAALSPADREALIAAARSRGPDLRSNRQALREGFEAMLALLRSVPFDAEAMARLLSEQRAAGNALQEIGQELLIDRFVRMTPDERAAYADRLDRSLTRPPPRR